MSFFLSDRLAITKLFLTRLTLPCLICFSLLFSGFVHSDQGQNHDENVINYKLLVLGDSLSAAYGLNEQQGWVAILARQWQKENQPIEVINAAISGDTTEGGLERLPRLLDLHQPTHLYIELGGNNGLQGHNPKVIRQNLEQKVQLANASGVEVILQEIQIPTNYSKRYTDMFVNNYHQLAEKYDIPLIPFFLQDIALDTKLMMTDGIHPKAEAQPMIVTFIKPYLERFILI